MPEKPNPPQFENITENSVTAVMPAVPDWARYLDLEMQDGARWLLIGIGMRAGDSQLVPNLQPGTYYTFRAIARDVQNVKESSDPAHVQTNGTAPREQRRPRVQRRRVQVEWMTENEAANGGAEEPSCFGNLLSTGKVANGCWTQILIPVVLVGLALYFLPKGRSL